MNFDPAQLQQFMQGAGMGGSQALIEFKAGAMQYDGKRVTPDRRRGLIWIVKDAQGVTSFEWKEAGSHAAQENIMVFPGDAKFEKVK